MVSEVVEAKRVLYRCLVRAAVVWGVDRENATHNPVYWDNGFLHYYFLEANNYEVYEFLSSNGIMSPTERHIYRLLYSFEELEEVIDHEKFESMDLELIIGLLFGQLEFRWGGITSSSLDAGPYYLNEPRNSQNREILEALRWFAKLGYLKEVQGGDSPRYQWERKAFPLIKKHLDIDPERDWGNSLNSDVD